MHPKGFAWGELVLEFGKEYVASDRGKCASFLPERSCFENAAQKARETNEELQYVEGLALSPLGPMLHAWNARGDEVFDFTWPCQHLVRYYGIPFSVSFLDEIGHKNGCVFGYLDPLLKYLREKIAAG